MKNPAIQTNTYGCNILVIDSNKLFVKTIFSTLNLHGLISKQAHCITEALQLTKSFKPDLTIIGHNISIKNSAELIRSIKSARMATSKIPPIICICKEDCKETRDHLLNAGVNKLLYHPISPFQLLYSIEELFSNIKLNKST